LVEKTIGALAAEDCRIAALLKEHNIDFCCAPNRLLMEACQENGVEYTALKKAIEFAIARKTNDYEFYQKMEILELIKFLKYDHKIYLRKQSKLINVFLNKLKSGYGKDYPFVYELATKFKLFTNDLNAHMDEEENVLLPLIEVIVKSYNRVGSQDMDMLVTSITETINEHNKSHNDFDEIKTLTSSFEPPVGASQTHIVTYGLLKEFETRLRDHVYIEDHILFPRAIQFEQELVKANESK